MLNLGCNMDIFKTRKRQIIDLWRKWIRGGFERNTATGEKSGKGNATISNGAYTY
jgi:hypothetical protein